MRDETEREDAGGVAVDDSVPGAIHLTLVGDSPGAS